MSEMFKQYMTLTIEPSPTSIVKCHQMILESGFFLVNAVHSEIDIKQRNEQVNDALIVMQMVLGKGLAINKLIEGLDFNNSINGARMRGLIDPTTIAVLTRTQFEAFANFHNIYNSSNDEDLTNLLYDLWVISGLKYRQATLHEDMHEEHRAKAEYEKQKIERIINEVHENRHYLALDEKQRGWVDERIKKRDFELLFKEEKFSKPGWRELFLNAGVKDIFMNLYSLLSLSTHPSNVSVFQYNQMYDKGFNEEMAYSFLSQSTIIMAFMIAEYCKYFPIAKQKFQELPELHQLLIDSNNGNFRGREYEVSRIRDKYKDEFQAEYEKQLKQSR